MLPAHNELSFAEWCEESKVSADYSWTREIMLGMRPAPHQVEDFTFLDRYAPRAGLFNEPGTGKTFPLQAHLLTLAALGNRLIATMPPVLVTQFFEAFKHFKGHDRIFKIACFRGDVETRDKLITQWEAEGWPDIIVTGFPTFVGPVQSGRIKHLRKTLLDKNSRAAFWNYVDFMDRGYNHVTVDEATAVKHPDSSLSRATRNFAGMDGPSSNGLVLMTGSPTENVATDAYGLISLLTPAAYGSYATFQNLHCVMSKGQHPVPVEYINKNTLHDNLYRRARRVLKKDVRDMPSLTINEILVELEDSHRALYKRLVRERVLVVGERLVDATSPQSLRMKMQRIVVTPELFTETPPKRNAVVEAVRDITEWIGPQKKLLLFAFFQESVVKLAKEFPERNPAMLYGGDEGHESSDAAIRRFKTDPTCTLLVANIRSGGYGLNLEDCCSYVAFAELVAIPGLIRQAIERVWRGMQAEPVTAWIITALGTSAVSIRNDLAKKDGQGNEIVRDARATLRDLLGEDGIQGQLE